MNTNQKTSKIYILLPNTHSPEVQLQNYIQLIGHVHREFMQDAFLEEMERVQSVIFDIDGNPINSFFSKTQIQKLDTFIKHKTKNNQKVNLNELNYILYQRN